MKLILLPLLLLPLLAQSQSTKVDTLAMGGYSCFGCDSTEFVIGYNKFITGDTLPILIDLGITGLLKKLKVKLRLQST